MNTSQTCTVIAGPCSVDDQNLKEIVQISQIEVKNHSGKHQRAVAGTRIVGLKSRTELSDKPGSMGIDYAVLTTNMRTLADGGSTADFETAPSVLMAEEITGKTGMIIATEVMMPTLQLPGYEHRVPIGKLMPWNPSVNQLGWQIHEIAVFARRNGWNIGIKNGKWGTMEKTWTGLRSYAGQLNGDIIFIHRGVDVEGKGNFRNVPVHDAALRTKVQTGCRLFFDPSHTYGPKLRDQIVNATVEAMKMKMDNNAYLYDGILIEVGTSKTDTDQHISLLELEHLMKLIASFRELQTPD